MEKPVSAADANRKFSKLLREVREGKSYVVTSHGRAVARIAPAERDIGVTRGARAALLKRLRSEPVVTIADMKRTALGLVEKLPESAELLPVQTLGELFNLLVRKAGRPPAKARKAILSWRDAFSLIETSAEVILSAADLATDHQFSIWDAVILSAAAEGGCRLLLLSQDLQEGFTWNSVTVTNPFAPKKNDLLIALLADDAQS